MSVKWKVEELAFQQQRLIFNLTSSFPRDELYGLTNQIRRSSRSIGANLREAYRKMLYVHHFTLKITDAYAENSETAYWLEIALDCGYCSKESIAEIKNLNDQIGKLLHYMQLNPQKFCHKLK